MTLDAQDVSLKIVRPTPGENLTIRTGSTFVIGTVSPPDATVTVNGVAADVSDDGAFLAFAPIQTLPREQSLRTGDIRRKTVDAVVEVIAEAGGRKERQQILVATPQRVSEPTVKPLDKSLLYVVREDQILSRTASTNWGLLHLPRGALVTVGARRGKQLRLLLPGTEPTWVNETLLQRTNASPPHLAVTQRKLHPQETRFTASSVVPFVIEQASAPSRLELTFYGPLEIRTFTVPSPTPQPSGFAARYEEDTLVLTQKIPARRPGLAGKVICLDPGHHPDAGAIGPRGLEERTVNLQVGQELEKLLTAAGAKVVFTRREEPLPLLKRRAAALQHNPDIFVSLHNNSVGDGTDPRANHGTSTFYYHPQSRPLAEALQAAMLKSLGFPDLKANRKSLAVCRISEFPAVLVEPAFIILPDHEKLLLSEAGRQKIASAIFDGIRSYFDSAATSPPSEQTR